MEALLVEALLVAALLMDALLVKAFFAGGIEGDAAAAALWQTQAPPLIVLL